MAPRRRSAPEQGAVLRPTLRLGRLQRRLRDELAEVPWLNPDWFILRRGGYLGWNTQVPAPRAGETLAEIDRTVRALATEGPTADELAAILNRQNSTVIVDYETAPSSAYTYAFWLGAGLRPGDTAAWMARRGSLKLDDVRLAAARLGAVRLRTVVVGDWKALREPLTGLGWGTIEVRRVDVSAGLDRERDRATP
jgi:hypothetical protein